jgi:hypothetical protein
MDTGPGNRLFAESGIAHDRIARVQVLATDHQRTGVKTNEKSLSVRPGTLGVA